jgi:hypothetical protein
MTRKRPKPTSKPDAPITGVAAGNLGTAANLDDTQVLRTEDLEAAAAEWFDDAAAARPIGRGTAPAPAGQRPIPAEPASPAPGIRPAPPAQSPAIPGPAPARPNRRPLALAGAMALIVLLVIGGSGIVSQLDLGTADVQAGASAAPTQPAPTATPAAKPQSDKASGGGRGSGGGGHGPKGCHGHRHNCGGGED